MFGKRLGIAILSVVTLLGATAVAQDEKNEVGGMIGRIFISDQPITGATYTSPTIAYGKGLTFEGFYGRRLLVTPLYAISGEAVLAYDGKELPNAGDYQNSVVPQSLKELFVTPAVRANLFPTTAVSPWASLGAGLATPRIPTCCTLAPTQASHHVVRLPMGHWTGCEGLETTFHSGRNSGLLVRVAGLSAGADGQVAAAELFCGRWRVLEILKAL